MNIVTAIAKTATVITIGATLALAPTATATADTGSSLGVTDYGDGYFAFNVMPDLIISPYEMYTADLSFHVAWLPELATSGVAAATAGK